MGVPKKSAGGKGKKKPARAPQQLTADEHFENAEMAFAMENFDQARRAFKRALDMEPENVEFLEGYGSFLAETGQRSEAATVLQRAAALQPDEGFEKYMYLGQLVEGAEAEQHVRKGISILRTYMQQQLHPAYVPRTHTHTRRLFSAADAPHPRAAVQPPAEGSEEAAEAAAEKQHLDATLCSCLCSLAEVLMNQTQEKDADIESVAAECEQLLSEARQQAPTSPEPLQALASLRQQQGKDEEALAFLRQSLALWFKPSEEEESEEEEEGGAPKPAAKEGQAAKQEAAAAAAAGKDELGSEDEDEESEDEMDLSDDDFDDLPSYEFRFETAKLLLELDESVDAASQVLEQLLEENDQDPNTWLLLAMCCQGGGDLEGALGAAEEGLALCRKLGLPAADETVAGFEAMQGELKAMIEGEAKEAKKAGKEKQQKEGGSKAKK